MIRNHWKTLLAAALFTVMVIGCVPESQPTTPTAGYTTTPTEAPTPAPTTTPTLVPTPAYTALPESEGPTLLLQTDFYAYQIIDFGLGITYDFTPPLNDQEYALASHVSPDGKQMLFIHASEGSQVIDLATGSVRASFPIDTQAFQPESTLQIIQDTLPDLSYTTDMLDNAIRTAYLQSLQTVSWFRDSDHLLLVQPGSDVTTTLALVELETGETTPLENETGFVQSVWVNPDGESLLLKKSLIFDANVWEDDAYYWVDLVTHEVRPLPLPEDVDNPSVGWFDQNHIQIVHQTGIAGSMGFSLLDIESMKSTLLVDRPFTGIRKLGDAIVVLTKDDASASTEFDLIFLQGESLAAQSLPGVCPRSFSIGQKLLVNCEEESVLLDKDLAQSPFGAPISQIVSAPIGAIVLTRENEAFLYDPSLENRQPLELAGEPLEFLWLPDSSGFLYRTYGMIYYYDLLTRSSQFLLGSDLFTDYRNLNAAWINLR
jgi:hypothetical protein